MKWFGWFRGNAAHEGGALSNPDKGEQIARPETGRTAANIAVSDERAMMVSAVFACVRLLVQTGATLPLGFYERTSDGRKPLDEDNQIVRLLKYKPNKFMTAKEFRQALWTQRVLWGNGYAHIKRSGGVPTSLTPLKPEFMTVERGETGLRYIYRTHDGNKVFDQRSILHLKGFSGDGIVGLSPLGFARETLGLSVAADRSAAKSINGRANAVLELDGYPTDQQKQELREMYGSLTDTTESSNGLAIIPGGMKYRGISIPPDDLQLLESRQFQISEVARFFSVPVVMIDGSSGATAAWPASYEQQVLSFLTFGLKPYLEEWEDAISNALLKPMEQRRYYAEHNVEGLLRADSTARAAFYSQMVQNGIYSRAEVRMRENLPYKDGTDTLTVQLNMTDINDLPEVKDEENVPQN